MMKRPRSFDDDEDYDDDDDRDHPRRHRQLDQRDSRSFDHHRRITTHRSESSSFSSASFRREIPKGFRSDRREHHGRHQHRRDRDRDRRFSSHSPSPTSSSSPLLRRFGSNESGDRHQHQDGRGRDLRASRDSSSGEPPKTTEEEEEAKAVVGERCSGRNSSSEMEEGELQPEPENEEILSSVLPDEEDVDTDKKEERRIVGTNGNGNAEVKELNDNNNNNGEDEESGNKKEEILEVKKPLVEEEKCVGEDCAIGMETSKRNKEEAETDGAVEKGASSENNRDEEDEPTTDSKLVTLDELPPPLPQENHKDKGKSVALSPPCIEYPVADEGEREEVPSSRRGFDLFFISDDVKENSSRTSTGKREDDSLELEALDLSLGLPGIPPGHVPKWPDTRPGSPSLVKSVHSMPSSFRTGSDGFTTSISFSGSQTFLHNPSCSLTQNSVDYEQSVGSHPLFQGADQVLGSTIWQTQASNEPKWKGGIGAGPLLQRVLVNGNTQVVKPDDLTRQCSLPRQLSPTPSHGSRGDTRSEHSKDKRLLPRERSSSSLFRSDQKEGEQLVLNAAGFERILSKIVSEPMQAMGRLLQEMTDHSVSYLKEAICEMVISADKRDNLHALQEALKRRLDLTIETMSKCPRTLLEILVALKTGLPDLLRRSSSNVPSSDLAEIFHNLKCGNLSCRTILPVDDCECKVCKDRSGFCSSCMCLVCSKFDNASNTCGWVGCDVCIHWCHTDCGLQGSHIRNGPCSGIQGMTEMQFHCVACNHPSEMFGFVKDVFMTCVKDWKEETLVKELQYVRRIFAASNDLKGQRLCAMANQMLLKIEVKANISEVINIISGFFSESEVNINNNPSVTPPKEPSRNVAEGSNGATFPTKELTWLPPFSSDRVSHRENTGTLFSFDYSQLGRQTKDAEKQMRPEKKPVVDELESVVRFKQAEAKMYQERADSARREAEGLKRIAVAKNVQVEEDYATKTAKLQLSEAEERRRKKVEELQVIERAHRQYFNMKMRMESEINDLLLKMEATKRNFST